MLEGQGERRCKGISSPLSSSKEVPSLVSASPGYSCPDPASMYYHMPLSLCLKAKSGFLFVCVSVLPSYPFWGSQLPYHLYNQYSKQFLFSWLDLD